MIAEHTGNPDHSQRALDTLAPVEPIVVEVDPRRRRRGAPPRACGRRARRRDRRVGRRTRRSSRTSCGARRSPSRRCPRSASGRTSTTPRSRSRARRTSRGPSSSSLSAAAREGAGDRGGPRVRAGADAASSTTAPESTPGCSLSAARAAGRATATDRVDHPCQQAMLAEVAAAAEVEPAEIVSAVDGCGVPTFALTLERMAHAFSRLEALDGGDRVARGDARSSRAHPRPARRGHDAHARAPGVDRQGRRGGPALRGRHPTVSASRSRSRTAPPGRAERRAVRFSLGSGSITARPRSRFAGELARRGRRRDPRCMSPAGTRPNRTFPKRPHSD